METSDKELILAFIILVIICAGVYLSANFILTGIIQLSGYINL